MRRTRNLPEAWEDQFDPEALTDFEDGIVRHHDGSSHLLPSAVTGCLLGLLLDMIESDIASGDVTDQTARMYVYASQLDNVVSEPLDRRFD